MCEAELFTVNRLVTQTNQIDQTKRLYVKLNDSDK